MRARSRRPSHAPQLTPRRLIGVIGLALALAYLVMLAGAFLQGHFLTDAARRPIANDFVDVYAAGQMALAGNAASAYDWPLHKAAEVRALGHDFPGYYGWHYPPPFLFVAAALALLPYLGAALVWLAGTLVAYAATLRFIVRDRAGIFVALGFPAAIWNVTAGQNGFLTATLIGGTLAALERRPALAGVLLGLLTYKPQFGLLFPLALIADRRWLTITVAAAMASAMAAAVLARIRQRQLAGVFSLAADHRPPCSRRRRRRFRPAAEPLSAWCARMTAARRWRLTVQGTGSVAAAVGIVWLWRSRAPFDLKAAALAAATLVATPYVYMYDVTVLAVAVGFLLHFALERGLSAAETCGLAAGAALILVVSLRQDADGSCRRADRAGAGRAARTRRASPHSAGTAAGIVGAESPADAGLRRPPLAARQCAGRPPSPRRSPRRQSPRRQRCRPDNDRHRAASPPASDR